MRKEITFDRFIRWTGTGLLIIAVLLLVNYLSGVLLPFFVAWLIAYLIYPIVQFIENKIAHTCTCNKHHHHNVASSLYHRRRNLSNHSAND